MRRLAPALFFVSGLAGLVLQVAWFRLLAQSLGGSLAAVTAVLIAFMAGLALGAWALGRKAAVLRDPVRAYGWLELAAGGAALATLPLVRSLDVVYGVVAARVEGHDGALLALKLALAVVVLLPSTLAMGGTLPALCQGLARDPLTAGRDTGGLYALNTLGAVAGTLLALFVLLPNWGLSRAVALGAGLDLAVGAVILLATRRRTTSAPAAEPPARRLTALSLVMAAVGFAGLSYEVLWTRVLAFYFGSGVHAFGLTLVVVLAGLALGGFLGGALADRTGKPGLVLACSQALLAACVAYQVWRLPQLPDFLYDLALRFERGLSFPVLTFLLLLGAVQVLLPATLCMGAALPAAVRLAVRAEGESGAVVGRLASANMLGTIPGALLAAPVLVPLVGVQRAMLLIAGGSLAIAVVVLALGATRRRLVLAGGAVAVAAFVVGTALAFSPQRIFRGSGVFVDQASRELLRLQESPHGTVSLERIRDDRGTWLSLSIDGVNVAGTSPPLLSCQALQGHLPLLLHANPREVLHVGFGSGGTAAAVAQHRGVERLTIAEINPEVLRVSADELRAVNSGVLEDPRVDVHVVDARNYLLGTTRKFDCILSDSVHPRYQGNANLYTVEYFRTCREHLREGGLVSAWLPIYSLSPGSLRSIVASLREVFPATSVWYLNSTVNEFIVIVGRTEEAPIAGDRMASGMAEPSVAASLARVGVTSPAHLLDFFVAEGEDLDALVADAELHFDDRPWVEFESAAVIDRDGSWRHNLHLVLASRRSVLPRLSGKPSLRAEMRVFEEATSHALRGHELLLSGQARAARVEFDRALELNPADREPWEAHGPPSWVRTLVAAP